MKAIILAAGMGKRLGDQQTRQPKCLLKIGEQSLLERHLEYLHKLPIEEVFITVGYGAQSIEAEIERIKPKIQVNTVLNPRFSEGSIVSLWATREVLRAGTDILLMDADVLYGEQILKLLLESEIGNCLLLDRDFEAGEEPVKICVHRDTLVEFRKQISPELNYDYCGESVGFFRFTSTGANRLAQRSEYYISQGLTDSPHEEAIRDLLLESPQDFGCVEITGLPWIEIDFPQDVERAAKKILPMIVKTRD